MNILSCLRCCLVALLALGVSHSVASVYSDKEKERLEKIWQIYEADDETCVIVCRGVGTANILINLEDQAAKNIINKLDKLDSAKLTPKQKVVLFIARIRRLASLSNWLGKIYEGINKDEYMEQFNKIDKMGAFAQDMVEYMKESRPERLSEYKKFDNLLKWSKFRKNDEDLFKELTLMVQKIDSAITNFETRRPDYLKAPIKTCKPKDLFFQLYDMFPDVRPKLSDEDFAEEKCRQAIAEWETQALANGVLRLWENDATTCMLFYDHYRGYVFDMRLRGFDHRQIPIIQAARIVSDVHSNLTSLQKIETIMAHWFLGQIQRSRMQDGRISEVNVMASNHFRKAAKLLLDEKVWDYLSHNDQKAAYKIGHSIRSRVFWAEDINEAKKNKILPISFEDFLKISKEILSEVELFDQAERAKLAKNMRLPWPEEMNAAPFMKLLEFQIKYDYPERSRAFKVEEFNSWLIGKFNSWLIENNKSLKREWEFRSGIKRRPIVILDMVIDYF
jgi:hypothetical protein